ncbi:MAG TPA: tetratricopeptide repeat protein [Steroidobacteraceae bacterium]
MPTELGTQIEEEDLFAAALALPVAERGPYLTRACSTNPALLARLTKLIEGFSQAGSFFNEGPTRAWDSADRIGPYLLVRELGEGGCGVAYLAEQTAPVKREVAIKVIKLGMDTKAVIARFEAERQALALMDHPNVARVFDAGATSEGRPYFVMELVRGIRITDYCNQSRLPVAERLYLFIQVCQAIQHAHQKGIIHRDIKPSNVLVTMNDGLPAAKVIDFGIAKATQGRLIDHTLHTEVDQIMGTPAYISPEQVEPGQAGVETRSDIYSLGVLLYELLTGRTPFDAHELAQAGIDRLRERLRTEEPLRPSRCLNSLDDEQLRRISESNGTTATKLVKQVRDDLDWIVMQCLEKEPARRYQTVRELMADIERYLRHDPVLARPPTMGYALRKLVRRNRIALAGIVASLAFVAFIIAFAVLSALHARQIAAERDHAEKERQNAQKVSNVTMNVFAIADPFQTFANGVSGSALLDQAARSIERELRDQPAPRARLLVALGRAYSRRGEFRPAIGYLTEATQILSRMPGAEKEALAAMINLSLPLRTSGDLQGARETLVQAEQLARRYEFQQTRDYADLLLNRARLSMFEGQIPAARTDLERSLHLYRTLVGPRAIEVAQVLTEQSQTFVWMDELVQAEGAAREAIAIYEETTPAMYPDRITCETTLAEVLYLQGRLDKSVPMLQDVLRKKVALFGPNNGDVVNVLDELAVASYSQGNLDKAERYSRDAIAKSVIVFGEIHSTTANVSTTLGRTLLTRGEYEEAETTLRQTLGVFAKTLPPDHQYIASTEYLLGELLLITNRPKEAEIVLTASMNRWKRGDAPPWRAMRSANALGEALYREGRITEATKYLSESLRELSADPKADREAKDKARARAKRYLRT